MRNLPENRNKSIIQCCCTNTEQCVCSSMNFTAFFQVKKEKILKINLSHFSGRHLVAVAMLCGPHIFFSISLLNLSQQVSH